MNNKDRQVTESNEKQILPRFPLSKIKKIAKCDKEYIITSNAAIVAISFAAELFIQSLAENGLSMSYLQQDKRSMKRNSKKITNIADNGSSGAMMKQVRLTLDGLIESVQRNEQFYFLEDVINRRNFNNDSKGSKKDDSRIIRSTETKYGKGNKPLDGNQSVLPFGRMETAILNLKNVDNNESGDDDQEEGNEEDVIDGVEEEEEEEEGTGKMILHDVDSEVELQREIEKMNTVEDIDDQTGEEEEDNGDHDDDTDEKVRSRERLMGREETTEEVLD